MGTAYEAQDALGIYQTSPEDGADIYEPCQSLGGSLIAREVAMLDWDFDPAYVIPPIMILYVSGANGTGTGTIRATGSSTLAYTAPGGTEGTAVTIANGETKTLIDGANASKYVRVCRVSSDNMAGTMKLFLVEPHGTTIAGPGTTTSGAQYFAKMMLRNRAAANTITNVKFWLAELGTAQVSDGGGLGGAGNGTITTTGSFATWQAKGAVYIESAGGSRKEIAWYSSRTATVLTVTGRGLLGTSATAGAVDDTVRAIPAIAFDVETPGSDGRLVALADNTTDPAGTWVTPVTEATALTVSSLAAQQEHGLLLQHHVPSFAGASPGIPVKAYCKYTISAVDYTQTAWGRYRVAGTAFWSLYLGVDAAPDFTAAAATTSTSSPITYALTPPGSGTRVYRRCVRYTDAYGVEGVNQDTSDIEIDSTGAVVTSPLQVPQDVRLTDRAGGVVNVQAIAWPGIDSPNPDRWKIYWSTDGADPDPSTDTPVTVTMTRSLLMFGAYVLDYDFAALEYATDLRVIVRAHRTSDSAESTNTTATTISVGTALPFQPTRRHVSLGRAWGVQTASLALDDTVTIPGTSSTAYLRYLPGETQFWVNSEMVLRAVYDSLGSESNRIYILNSWALVNTTQGAAGAATWYEVLSWTGGDKRVSVNVASTRQLIFDATNRQIICAEFQFPGAVALAAHPNPTDGVWSNSSATVFHVLDATTHTWKAWAKITSAGVWDVQLTLDQMRS